MATWIVHLHLAENLLERIAGLIDYIKTFYQRRDEKIQALYERPYIYLS